MSPSLPGGAFGIDNHTVMGEWKIFETYFNHTGINYDTNFGFDTTPDGLTKSCITIFLWDVSLLTHSLST